MERPARRFAQGVGLPPGRLLRLLLGVVMGLMLMGAPPPARAQGDGGPPGKESRLVLSEVEVWGFAESLLRSEEYYRAATEYERLRHYFPGSAHARAAAVRIAEAHLYGGETSAALERLDALLNDPAYSGVQDDLRYLRGLARLELQSWRPYRLRLASIDAALTDFQAVAPASPRKPALNGFAEALADTEELPGKSPWLAGGLSALVPGAGSFYVGHYAEGSLAFVVTGLLIYATVEAHDRDDDDLAVVLGLGALAFYGGSIYAAANGAHKFNDRTLAGHLDRQRDRFGLRFERGGLHGVLNLRY